MWHNEIVVATRAKCPEMTFSMVNVDRDVYSKWQGVLSSYSSFLFSSVVVGVFGSLIYSETERFTVVTQISGACD